MIMLNITTQEFNKSTPDNFTGILKQASLTRKSDIADFFKKDGF